MKRFKLRELIVKMPVDPKDEIPPDAKRPICNQVTLLECANGVTRVDCLGATISPECRQVTYPNCANQVTRVDCGVTAACHGVTVCQQVTLLECGGSTRIVCDGRTIEPACRQVTLVECGSTHFAPQGPGSHYGGCKTQNCPPDPEPDPPPPPDPCGGDSKHHTQACSQHCPDPEDARLFVRTYEIDRMPLEDLSQLKRQLGEMMARAELAEARFEPQEAEDLDMLEKQLEAGLEEIRARKKGLKGPDTP